MKLSREHSNGVVLEVVEKVYEFAYPFKLNILKLACGETSMDV